MGDQLSNGATHGVADRNETVPSECVSYCNDVVGAVFERERAAQPDAMSALVESHERVSLGNACIEPEPVEVGGDGPPMDEHERGHAANTSAVGGPVGVADRERTSVAEVDNFCGW